MFELNLKKCRLAFGLSQKEVAEKVYVSQQAYAKWETGKATPNPETISLLANLFNVSTDYLLGYSQETKRKGVMIPVLGKVIAGVPIEAVEEILDYEEITPELAKTGTFFALKIQGASMEPKLFEGDIVVVKQQNDIDSGEIAVVLVNGQNATVKQIIKQDNGIFLHGFNPSAYTPVFYTNEQIETLPVAVLGKVIESRRKF